MAIPVTLFIPVAAPAGMDAEIPALKMNIPHPRLENASSGPLEVVRPANRALSSTRAPLAEAPGLETLAVASSRAVEMALEVAMLDAAREVTAVQTNCVSRA